MSRFVQFAMAAIVAAGSLFSTSTVSMAADFIVRQAAPVSLCADQRFLKKIVHRFDYQVRHVPNLPNVGITDFYDIHETRYLPQAERQPIARLYCGARVSLTDGNMRDIWYLIEGRMGFAGMGDNVEFCVAGFDRWFVYDGRCRVLR
ncbi:hypothetical protein C7441_10355 [Pseudaminobacter salicylatoxidans]|uniref:Uncharacterized protein n=1 Tax=Pseudaminobacter salicylatoxidans TaxID=93369 RepID=A0A316C643_PSESE|nr:hypothetical protein [Pseudaminobacter salicylatoxidans]PWJ85200.1 hypothetical protein C7441_10355 [Pseudaminobacter salicylatoxidans]